MPDLTFYLSREEHAWVKAQGPGFVRSLVREAMDPDRDLRLIGTGEPLRELARRVAIGDEALRASESEPFEEAP